MTKKIGSCDIVLGYNKKIHNEKKTGYNLLYKACCVVSAPMSILLVWKEKKKIKKPGDGNRTKPKHYPSSWLTQLAVKGFL